MTTLASDTFARTTTGGWGTAATGGAWTATNTTYYSVNGSQGVCALTAGTTEYERLGSVSSTSTEVVVSLGLAALPAGGSAYYYVHPRSLAESSSATTSYGFLVLISSAGAVSLYSRVNGTNGNVVATGITVSAADQLTVRARVDGVSPTTLSARVWKSSTTEPTSWQINVTDSTAGLQVAGAVALGNFLSSAATNGPLNLVWDSLNASTVTAAANTPPVVTVSADQTATLNNPVTVTGTASDSGGSIASTAWSWVLYPAALSSAPTLTGGSTLTASFTPSKPGAYILKLTATDNTGATTSANALVDVPSATVTVNNDVENSGTWLGAWTDIDELEATPDDTTYVTSSGSGTRTFWLAPATSNTAGYVWVRCDQPATGATLTAALLQGTTSSASTVVGSWPVSVPTNAPTTFRFALTSTQISAITDWNRLQIRFS